MDERMREIRRSEFMSASLLGGLVMAGGVLFGPLSSGGAADVDARALQLILTVEYTEEAFYSEALARGFLRGELRDYAQTVVMHERAHLAYIKRALGKAAEPRPKFEFGSATRTADAFTSAAPRLEDLAVSAYNGQGPNVSPSTLEAAARVVSVEARHAAWIRSIAGARPAADATDRPRSADEVLDGLRQLGLKR
jgi:hypothetical protein